MPTHDPFSPESAVAPPNEGPTSDAAEQDSSVLQADEQPGDAAPETGQEPAEGAEAEIEAPAAEEPETPAEPDPDTDVRVGTAKEVMDWVLEAEDDARAKVRARAALDAENATGEPRKGLSADLEELLSDDADASQS